LIGYTLPALLMVGDAVDGVVDGVFVDGFGDRWCW